MNFSNANLPTTQLVLDSKYATYTRENGAVAVFPIADGVDSPTEFHAANIQLLQFQAFNTIYNIDSTNNKLEIFVQTYNSDFSGLNSGNTSTVVSISEGSYSAETLVDALNTAILATCTATLRGSHSGYSTYYYYTGFGISSSALSAGQAAIDPVTWDSTTGKITFQIPSLTDLGDKSASNDGSYNSSSATISGNSTFASHIYSGFYLLTNTYKGLLSTLGFDTAKSYDIPTYDVSLRGVGVYLTPTVTYASNVMTVSYTVDSSWQLDKSQSGAYTVSSSGVTSPGILDLSYPRSINIVASGIPTNNRSVTPNLSYGNLFANVPITVGFGETISYEPFTSFPLQITNFQLTHFTVSILDEDGEAVNFHNSKWKLVIGINWTYDLGAAGEEDTSQGRTTINPYSSVPSDKLYKRRRY